MLWFACLLTLFVHSIRILCAPAFWLLTTLLKPFAEVSTLPSYLPFLLEAAGAPDTACFHNSLLQNNRLVLLSGTLCILTACQCTQGETNPYAVAATKQYIFFQLQVSHRKFNLLWSLSYSSGVRQNT